jgi:quinol monooxygenase YgiN
VIIIHAFLKVDPKHRDDFLQQAKQVTAPSQAEEGNISYQFFEAPQQPNQFVFLEKWQDQAAITFHEETAHFKAFVEGVQRVLSEPLYVELFEAAELH